MATGNFFKHWPTMLLGVVVAVILLVAVFSYQLNQTESAVVTTFGRPAAITEPGLHFRWPFPFQKIYKFDHRIRCFEGGSGKIEETMTEDGQNVLVGIFVNYRIDAVEKFFISLENMTNAEDRLNSLMRSAKNATIGQYKFSQIINTNPELMKLGEIQGKIQSTLERDTAIYGIKIVSVGINTINVPESISEKVFERMLISVFGWMTPIWAAVLHAGSTLIIIFNSARLVRTGEELTLEEQQQSRSDAGAEE